MYGGCGYDADRSIVCVSPAPEAHRCDPPSPSSNNPGTTITHTSTHNTNTQRQQVKCLVRQLLSAVAFLHSKAVLHRDIKLSNLLYTADGHLKLCDFGLARRVCVWGGGV